MTGRKTQRTLGKYMIDGQWGLIHVCTSKFYLNDHLFFFLELQLEQNNRRNKPKKVIFCSKYKVPVLKAIAIQSAAGRVD
jgi:hypothetical protein